MFQRFPIFQRLISWTKPDAPVERESREYEWYDHNSLVAEEPDLRALVPGFMKRDFDLPSRPEMLAGLTEFANRAQVEVRYACTWEGTRREGDETVLETSDGEYRCRAAVFAIGVTEPWVAPVPGLELASHYVDTKAAEAYENKRVFIVGKRNSGFEIAQSILPWASQVILASPRPVDTKALALSPLRVRYLHPYDEYARGGPGTYVLDAVIERVERSSDGFRVSVEGTSHPFTRQFEADEVIATTGFRTPLRDLPELGVATVKDGRIPALTPFWESVSVPGIYFAGNTTQGARGIGKRGLGASSSSVNGFRYNARVLAYHLAQRLGMRVTRPRLPPARDRAVRPPRALACAGAVDPEGLPGTRADLCGRGQRPGHPSRQPLPGRVGAGCAGGCDRGGPVGHDLSDRLPPAVRGDQGASAAGSPVARVRGRVVHRRSRVDPPLAD